MNVLVVDDEQPAREELKRFLAREQGFKLVGEASNGQEALDQVQKLSPDVLFLDIRMPTKDGLQVAAELADMDQPPLVVFVTAYDQHALEAFELNAVDYILKPYDDDRFTKACDKVRHTLQTGPKRAKEQLESIKTFVEQGKPATIVGHRRNSRDRVFLHQSDILYFHVKLTEVSAHTVNAEEFLVNSNLKSLVEILDVNRFYQTHRAYIVNLDHVAKVSPLFSGNFKLILRDSQATSIPLSRRFARKLRQALKW